MRWGSGAHQLILRSIKKQDTMGDGTLPVRIPNEKGKQTNLRKEWMKAGFQVFQADLGYKIESFPVMLRPLHAFRQVGQTV